MQDYQSMSKKTPYSLRCEKILVLLNLEVGFQKLKSTVKQPLVDRLYQNVFFAKTNLIFGVEGKYKPAV